MQVLEAEFGVGSSTVSGLTISSWAVAGVWYKEQENSSKDLRCEPWPETRRSASHMAGRLEPDRPSHCEAKSAKARPAVRKLSCRANTYRRSGPKDGSKPQAEPELKISKARNPTTIKSDVCAMKRREREREQARGDGGFMSTPHTLGPPVRSLRQAPTVACPTTHHCQWIYLRRLARGR